MNLNIDHTIIPFNYQTTWPQHVTPIVIGKFCVLPIFTYPTWYNVIPPFVPLNPSLYPTNLIRKKGFDLMIFRNYIGYVPRYVYPVSEQPIAPPTYTPHFVGNQLPIMVQLVTSRDKIIV
jgi:hypothetical protein